jgi:hypothetical protein
MALLIDTEIYGVTGGFYPAGVGTIPKGKAITGTVTATNSSRNLNGTATQFLTDGIRKGDTISFLIGGVRTYFKVAEVVSELQLILDSIPTGAAGPVAAQITRPMFRRVRIVDTTAGVGLVNGAVLSGDNEVDINYHDGVSSANIPVITYDSTGTTFEITTY